MLVISGSGIQYSVSFAKLQGSERDCESAEEYPGPDSVLVWQAKLQTWLKSDYSIIPQWISQWSVQEQNRQWRNIKSCCQAKQLFYASSQHTTHTVWQYAVRLSRKDLRLLVGLLTGHNTLNRHLTLLMRIDDSLCPLCGEEEDTSLHL